MLPSARAGRASLAWRPGRIASCAQTMTNGGMDEHCPESGCAASRAGGERGARPAPRAGWTGSIRPGGGAASAALAAIADAEREGELRARRELSGDVLRQLARAAKRKREADREYEQAIARAGRLGLSHREIAAAAEISHGTVRAILTRATASLNGNEPQAAEEESTASDDIAQ